MVYDFYSKFYCNICFTEKVIQDVVLICKENLILLSIL